MRNPSFTGKTPFFFNILVSFLDVTIVVVIGMDVIGRDISWGNIMMKNDENGRMVAKLVDLGKAD